VGIEQLGVLNKAHKWRRRSDEIRFGKSNLFLNPLAVREEKRDGGRWGVVPASEQQEILVALASLIRARRYEMALAILDNELGGGC
jgi:hypothetical protein